MSCSNWRSNIAVGCGVIAGILLALWFSTVVALGPAPGNILRSGEKQPAERNQADRAPNRQARPDKEEQQTATKEAECSNPGQSYHDCLIQLRTARATERQADVAKSTERVAWIALIFAAIAAAAAWWTVTIMRKTAERQLRAYVFVDSISLADASQIPLIPLTSISQDDLFAAKSLAEDAPKNRPRGIPGVTWSIRNSGQTPAHDVTHWGRFDVSLTSQEHLAVAPAPSAAALKTYMAAGSTNTKTHWHYRVLTEQEMDDIRTGVRAVYVFGRIDYRDAFKRKRCTTYRMKYTVAAYPPIGPTVFNYCDEGNEAD